MEKKYRTEKDPKTGLLRIIALKDFGGFDEVRKGDKGGLIEKEENLSQKGYCWIFKDARVEGNASRVYENAWVKDKAKISGNAQVFGDAIVCDSAQVYGDAEVFQEAKGL